MLLACIVSATAYFSLEKNGEDSFFKDNVEALSQYESNMQIKCDMSSIIMFCKWSCICGIEYSTREGYGRGSGLRGTCSCGRTYY